MKYPTHCIGFGATDGACLNPTGWVSRTGRKNKYWCPACDAERIETVGAHFDKLMEEARSRANPIARGPDRRKGVKSRRNAFLRDGLIYPGDNWGRRLAGPDRRKVTLESVYCIRLGGTTCGDPPHGGAPVFARSCTRPPICWTCLRRGERMEIHPAIGGFYHADAGDVADATSPEPGHEQCKR